MSKRFTCSECGHTYILGCEYEIKEGERLCVPWMMKKSEAESIKLYLEDDLEDEK